MAYIQCMQYTVRDVPAALDKAMRQRARARGKSLNELAIEVLAEGLGLREVRRERRDLSDIVGTWKKDAVVEAALAAQDEVDEQLWK